MHQNEPRPRGIRIGVVAPSPADLPANLQALPGHPVVERFDDLYGDAAAITAFAPRVLFVGHGGADFDSDRGAIRVLRALAPDLAVILCHGDACTAVERAAAKADGLLLYEESGDANLAAIVARALAQGVDPDTYLQFVQGICDEINNPLMFASGHLQLLASRFDPERDGDALAQIEAVKNGLSRIQRTMHKVQDMGRATPSRRSDAMFTVAALLGEAAMRLKATDLQAELHCADDVRSISVRGDVELLASALLGLCEVGCALSTAASPVVLEVLGPPAGVTVRLRVTNPKLEEWELRRAFEPYELNTVLRGTTLGLNLFLVQLVARAHGWDAFARRLAADRVEFCIGAESRSVQPM